MLTQAQTILTPSRHIMWPRLIGFAGPAGAGKSFAAGYLANRYGYSRVRFAGPLKGMMRALGLSEEEIDGALKEMPSALLGGRTPRHAMQTLGTEWGRCMIDDGLWLRAWSSAADRFLADGLPVVVDDVRFLNEAGAIWERSGVVIRVDRHPVAASSPAAAHASENQIFPYDERVRNSGVLKEFCAALDCLVTSRTSIERVRS